MQLSDFCPLSATIEAALSYSYLSADISVFLPTTADSQQTNQPATFAKTSTATTTTALLPTTTACTFSTAINLSVSKKKNMKGDTKEAGNSNNTAQMELLRQRVQEAYHKIREKRRSEKESRLLNLEVLFGCRRRVSG